MKYLSEFAEIDRPAIDGYLEVVQGVVIGGMRIITNSVREDLDEIQSVLEGMPNSEEPLPQVATETSSRHYSLGKLAAIKAFIEEPDKKTAGFKL